MSRQGMANYVAICSKEYGCGARTCALYPPWERHYPRMLLQARAFLLVRIAWHAAWGLRKRGLHGIAPYLEERTCCDGIIFRRKIGQRDL